MKANELRIGNWVYYNGNHNEIGKITEIGTDMLNVNAYVRIDFRVNKRFTDIKPIPLTEEILLKCGLQIREITVDCKQQKHYSDFRNIAIEVLSKDYLMLGLHKGYEHIEPIRRVEYLHQLQNLYFSLTNEELTFNNL